jgi:hypothetical protein
MKLSPWFRRPMLLMWKAATESDATAQQLVTDTLLRGTSPLLPGSLERDLGPDNGHELIDILQQPGRVVDRSKMSALFSPCQCSPEMKASSRIRETRLTLSCAL